MQFNLKTPNEKNKAANYLYSFTPKFISYFTKRFNIDSDTALMAVHDGIIYAINNFDETKANASIEQYTFHQIKYAVLEMVKAEAGAVRIPQSAQRKALEETGSYITGYMMSGDAPLSDAPKAKSFFDIFAESEIDFTDNSATILKELCNVLRIKFPERARDIDIISDYFGLDGVVNLKGREIASKYDISEPNVTRIRNKMVKVIKGDKECMDLMNELYANLRA